MTMTTDDQPTVATKAETANARKGSLRLRTRSFFKLVGAAAGVGVASQVASPSRLAFADQVQTNPLSGVSGAPFTLQSQNANAQGNHAFDFTLLPNGTGSPTALINIRTNGNLDLNNAQLFNVAKIGATQMNGSLDLQGYNLNNVAQIGGVSGKLTLAPSSGTSVGIGTSDPTFGNRVVSALAIGGSQTGLAIANPDGIPAFALNPLSTHGWTLFDYFGSTWNAGISQQGGSVGIGTPTPVAQLVVDGPGQTSAAIADAGSLGGTLYLQDTQGAQGNGGALLFGMNMGTSAGFFAALKGYGQDGNAYTRGDLAFSTRNSTADTALTERMRITSDGSLGIGTPTPSSGLEVSSSSDSGALITSQNTWMSGSPIMQFGMNAGNNAGLIQLTSGKDLKVYNGQYALTILGSNGDVGIGTTTPHAQLSVVASGANEIGDTAMSATLRSSAGALVPGTDELCAASFGVQSGGNNIALGVRAYSASPGTGWGSALVSLGLDVDETVRAGPSIWLGGNGYVGISAPLWGGAFTPQATLHVNGGQFWINNTVIADQYGCYYA